MECRGEALGVGQQVPFLSVAGSPAAPPTRGRFPTMELSQVSLGPGDHVEGAAQAGPGWLTRLSQMLPDDG